MLRRLLLVTLLLAPARADRFPFLGLELDARGLVIEVAARSAAERAGMQAGDQLLTINGTPAADLRRLRGTAGSTVTLTWQHAGKTCSAELVRAPADAPPPESAEDVAFLQGRQLHPALRSDVLDALALLPSNLKQSFFAFGTRVDTRSDIGGAFYSPSNHHVVFREREAPADGAEVDRRRPITVLHELGHAYNHMRNWLSKTPEFLAAYDSEAPRVPAADRALLSHFLQPGPAGPNECVASLFACSFFHRPDRRLDRLRADFPRCLALVEADLGQQ